MITRSNLEFFQHFCASASRQLTNNGQNSKQKLEDFLVFPQDNKVGDDRGAQHSHPDSTYPQWSSSSSSSSKSSFCPPSSSASGGVFGSTARNDRTSALKAAFQVFIFHLSLLGMWKARWPHGWRARLRSERSGFEPWLGTLCCVLG